MKIKAWNFNIVWEDGTEEKNVDYAAKYYLSNGYFFNFKSFYLL